MTQVLRDRPTTAEVRAMRALPAEGDMIRPGWTRNIRSRHDQSIGGTARQVSRTRPFAIMLLARVCFMYSPSPAHDANGKVIGWARKFRGPFWYPNWAELAEEFGCSTRTLRDECALLVELGLICTQPTRERTKADGAKNVPEFVIPKIKNILKITDRPAVSDVFFEGEKADEETSDQADEVSSDEPMKKLPEADEVSSVGAEEVSSSFPHNHTESSNPETPRPASSTSTPGAQIVVDEETRRREVADALSLFGIMQPGLGRLAQKAARIPITDFEATRQQLRNDYLAAQDGKPGAPEIDNWPGYVFRTFESMAEVYA